MRSAPLLVGDNVQQSLRGSEPYHGNCSVFSLGGAARFVSREWL